MYNLINREHEGFENKYINTNTLKIDKQLQNKK